MITVLPSSMGRSWRPDESGDLPWCGIIQAFGGKVRNEITAWTYMCGEQVRPGNTQVPYLLTPSFSLLACCQTRATMKLLGLLFVLSTLTFPGWAQPDVAQPSMAQPGTDSVRTLDEVHITGSRLERFASGDKVAPVLTHTIGTVEHTYLSELLTNYSGLNVRSYGPSGLSTASLRGTGNHHTAVFWEGINLQSAMNGSLDLTLVPVSFIDNVALQYGGAGSLFGSGTLGGAIHLASDQTATTGWNSQLYQHIGSFGSRYTGVNAGYHRQRTFATHVRAFSHQADYDFPFYNIYTNREARRQNAGIRQQGILVENQWTPAAQHTLSAKYWYQDNLVHVPEVAAAGGEARTTQADAFHRAVVHWQHQQKSQEWHVRTALLHHQLVYDDKISLLASSQSTSWITEAEHTYYLSEENWLHTGLNHTYETAEVDNYASPVQRNRTALFLSYRTQLLPLLEATVGARETLIDGHWSPFLPSLGLRYAIGAAWQLTSKVARSYRVPTFNDLYWAGAGGEGNPNLQPETGWSTELGVRLETPTPKHRQASAELTLFSNSIDQWIGWIPVTGSVWTPINVEQVWARGVELSSTVLYRFASQLSARVWGSYSYTKSTKEGIEAGGSLTELHKQLIYTPYHQAKASVNLGYRQMTLGYSWRLTGEQFTTSSNRRVLPAYQVSDLSLAYTWPVHPKHQVLINGKVNNLWDKAYDVRQGYPMPGRNYQLSLMYQFNQSP